jgi:hypothetical protein
MLAAYAEQAMAITPKHVRMAAKDSEYGPQRRLPAWAGMAAAGILLLAVAGTLYWLYAGRGDITGSTETATGSPPAASPAAGSGVAGSGQAREAAPADSATASAGAPVAASSGQNAPQPSTPRADQASGMASSASASGAATSP